MTVSPVDTLTALQRWELENDRFDLAVARAYGVGITEIRAIGHIQTTGELTPRALGYALGLSSGAVTALIDRLERSGWVTRSPHPVDRRSVVLRATDRSREIAERVWKPYAEALAEATADLPATHRESLAWFLTRAADIAAEGAREWRGTGPAPTALPARGSPPTPAA